MSLDLGTVKAMRPRISVKPPAPLTPILNTANSSPAAAVMGDIVNNVAAPFQSAPDPAKGALGAIEHGIGAVMGVVGAPFELMDTGFALATSGLAAMMPGLPAATLMAPHLGMPHGHLHPPSLIPPAVLPIPLPSIGTVMCAGCVSVLVGGIPAARAGDVGLAVLCFSTAPAFEVYTGSSNTWIGGSRAARMTDITRHCNPASALGKLGAAMGAVGVAAGAAGAGGSASAGAALQASMQAAQAAADAAALAMSALLGKDPGVPPALGALMLGNPTVLIGGFPLPDLLDVLGGIVKGLKKLKKLTGDSPKIKKALAKVGLCNSPGEPVDPFTGVVYNDFDDYQVPGGFTWERHYRSNWNEADGALGYGFRHFYDRRLLLLRKQAVYEAHDGEQAFIPQREDSKGYVSDAGFRLESPSLGVYILHTDRDEELHFAEQPTSPKSARLSRYRANGVDLHLTYDERGRLYALSELKFGATDTTLHYDAHDHLIELRRGTRFEQSRVISRYEYSNNCLSVWQDALGHQVRLGYDAQRRMIQGTDRRGYSFYWEYDERTGRCVRGHGDDGLWGIEAEYEGSQSVFTEPDGGKWIFKLFPDGVVSHRLDPNGGLLQYVRDEQDRIVEQITPGGQRFAWFYDDKGQHYGRADQWGHPFAPEDEEPEPDDPLAHDGPLTAKHWLWGAPLEELSQFSGGLSASIVDELVHLGPLQIGPLAAPPEPQRDAMGRPLERLGENGLIERYRYDAEGNVVGTQNCHGNWSEQTITSWDLVGERKSPLGHITHYEYSHREKLKSLVDAAGNRTDYVLDQVQQTTEERRCDTPHRLRTFDLGGGLVQECDANGDLVRAIVRNKAGLPEQETLGSGEVYHFSYDGRGRPSEASSSQHEVTLRHLRELRCADQRDGQGVEHAYESWLGIRRTTYFERFSVEYSYGGGMGVQIRTPEGSVHRVYAGSRGVVVRENANGTSEATVFDQEERLCSRVCWPTDYPHSQPTWTERYTYSPAGELESWVDSRYGPSLFSYDADQRLVLAEGSCGRLEYEYDATNNLIGIPGEEGRPGTEPVRYAQGNRVFSAGQTLYQHDSERRRCQDQLLDGSTVDYQYDSRGQLLRVTWSDRQEVWTAAYDGLGRRLWKQYGVEGDNEASERTDFNWDGDRLAAERFPDGRIRLYVFTNEDALVPFCFVEYDSDEAEPEGGTVYYLYAGPNGMPLRVEDSESRVVWEVRKLHPFGRIELEPGAKIDLCLRFAGHYFDEQLGLHYNRFRDYDPQLGRYLQPDPIGHEGGVNLYGYPVNPLVDVDLRGLVHRKGKKKAKIKRKRKKRARRREENSVSPTVTQVPSLNSSQLSALNASLANAHLKAKAGDLGADFHGDTRHNFSRERARQIIMHPDSIHLSSHSPNSLVYYQGGDMVVVRNGGPNSGDAITGYGKTGTLGETGVAATGGGHSSDPGRPVTASEISTGTLPGNSPSAQEIWSK